ncbi:hypothetical protein [Aliarcobacter butzleri]|uniref:hypothetical protein n=1 Tax=Aliarcobacter butzleri TaxID=28197 RepID=UPI00126049AE|nr:hypothetical protein [Aliarcobacter butzleri]
MTKVLVLNDKRINATNYLFQIKIGEYLKIAKKIIDDNEFQRKRIKNSNSVYSLLKEDILKGCSIPPIVLAINENDNLDIDDIDETNIINKIKEKKIIILDGLQRTWSLLDLESMLEQNQQKLIKDDEKMDINLENFYDLDIRLEVYVGLNKLGILYRMLTLNTGQTPMSLRQQVEMVYLGYLDQNIDEIKLIKEMDNSTVTNINQYKFEDAIEAFNAYLDRNELPIIKADILENIKTLEKLSKENQNNELFREFMRTWHNFLLYVNDIFVDTELENSELPSIYGKNIINVFKKAQGMSGFGSAIGHLIDYNDLTGIHNIKDIDNLINKLILTSSKHDFLYEINKKLEWIKNNSKKIGNAQRMFFQYYFRDLFNKDSHTFLKLFESIEVSFKRYQSQNFLS